MQPFRDGTPENGIRLSVKGLQSTHRQIELQLSRHIKILVKDEFDLLILLAAPFDKARPGVELYPAAAADVHFAIHTTACGDSFCHIFLCKRPKVTGGDELGERNTLQSQRKPGDEIQIPQSYPLKMDRLCRF